MNRNYTLLKETTGLLLIDAQEKLFYQVESSCEVVGTLFKVISGFQIMHLPIMVTEQYPQGLGATIAPLKNLLGSNQKYLSKTTFSCLGDPQIRQAILALPITQWVLCGLEAHVCVLQTAKELLAEGKQVVVLNDAITSRSVYDFSTAIAEMRDCGARISSTETVLFELLRDSKAVEFKQLSQLFKNESSCCNNGCGSC